MLVSDDAELIAHAHKLATQARDPAPHYQHSEIGYNYRLSNVLAGIGRGQLQALAERVQRKRGIFESYRQLLGDLPGISFMPEAPWGRCTRWLTVITVDPEAFGAPPAPQSWGEAIRLALEAQNIESRPLWKPMHLQPVCAPLTPQPWGELALPQDWGPGGGSWAGPWRRSFSVMDCASPPARP